MGLYHQSKKREYPVAENDRHHLLFPARVWREAGEDAQFLRGYFIVHLPREMHEQIHREINDKIGDFITAYDLPTMTQIKYLADLVRKDEQSFSDMQTIAKLEWLKLHMRDNACAISKYMNV